MRVYSNEERSLGVILDRLQECTDTIARLVVAQPLPADKDALLVMDRALRTLEANGRDGE